MREQTIVDSESVASTIALASQLFLTGLMMLGVTAQAFAEDGETDSAATGDAGFLKVAAESITGDVYGNPERWQALSYGDFFSKGWNRPWVSPPNGGGGAPRQGWLNAQEGVFYRLGLGVFGFQDDVSGGAHGYSGSLTVFTPLNQRMQIQTDLPFVTSTKPSGSDRETHFGDLQITPRFMLSESRDLTQTFNLGLRMPTGDDENGNNVAALTPNYQFWTNPTGGMVVRGGFGFTIPYAGRIDRSGLRSTFNANVAAGYYFTPHDLAPIGDLVGYVSTNLTQTLDNRGSDRTVVTIGPGFRSHLGRNWYLLGSADFPVTNADPYDYQILSALMKVF